MDFYLTNQRKMDEDVLLLKNTIFSMPVQRHWSVICPHSRHLKNKWHSYTKSILVMYLITELIEIDSFSDLSLHLWWLMYASTLVTFKPIHILLNTIISSCQIANYIFTSMGTGESACVIKGKERWIV